MAEKLTPQQEMAVNDRGGDLLISAAAGSGKTKVLVDRLMAYVLDPVRPVNLDEFLIITYTKAAAAELRGKIAAKLTEHMAAAPDNRHLQRQMQRLYMTKISTVHAFCSDLLREYAYRLDLPADFRVADENECAALRETVMTRMLDSAYETAETDGDFRAFVDGQGLGRDDRLVPEILMKVYDSARCHLDPEKWLDSCIKNGELHGVTDIGDTPWGRFLIGDFFAYLDLQIQSMKRCVELADACDGMEKPAVLLKDTLYQLQYLRSSGCWDDILQRKNIDYGRMVFSKKCGDPELAEHIKAVRNACKKGLEKKLKRFTDPSGVVLGDMAQTAGAVRGIVALVRRFGVEFDKAKKSRRILDFGDLEHRTLDLLLGKSRSGTTALASEIGSRFCQIMVDEYQDSNAVQDAIFRALSAGRNNCFMVGDVKQSIYQFRLADPGIFLEKYNTYADAENAMDGQGRKILLSHNFRSGGAVLKSVNDVFFLCMSPDVGGLRYGTAEALQEGVAHVPLGEPEVEFWGIDVQESTYEEEAAFVARRVAELLDGTHMIRQGVDALRPIQPEDVAILLRSPGSVGKTFIHAMQERGIRCTSGGGEDLLQTEEISALRSLLQIISNPRQDIPLIAILTSPVFGFTADDLAMIRSVHKADPFYDAMLTSDLDKVSEFLNILAQLRMVARMETLAQLVEKIFLLTGMDNIYAAMPGGEEKKENLLAFYTMAVEFEQNSRHDLEQFLAHIEALEEKGLILSGENDMAGAVKLMSIHKSKGLEFPVVFVCGLSREFNRESARAQVLCDQNLGLGLSVVDADKRLRYPTVAKRAIALKTEADSLSEEMRVLYVALTRPKDRLIMTYASRTLDKDVIEISARMALSAPELLTRDVVCPGEWVLMAALMRTEAGELHALGGRPPETKLGDPVWKIGVVREKAEISRTMEQVEEKEEIPHEIADKLEKGLTFQYPFPAAMEAPSKQTATQRKGREKDAEAAENTPEPTSVARSWRVPTFRQPKEVATDRGNAMHRVMQYIRYECCGDESGIRSEIQRLKNEGFLSTEQEKMVNLRQISAFFLSDFGKKLRSADIVLREFKFSVLDPAENYAPELKGEKILLQGVVDCAVVEDDGIIIVDFKTDYVTEMTLPEKISAYRPQITAYAEALSRIYGKPVKKTMLYFFSVGQFAEV